MENKNKSLKIYEGDIQITKENSKEWEKKLEYTEIITGSVCIRENAKANFPKLESVSGYVYIQENKELEKQFWKILSKNKWYVSNLSSEWLLSQKGNFIYKLNNVEFPKEWFDKIRKDELSPEEVFAIDNQEHRRVAYAFMDKTKMKQLKDFQILDEQTDDKGNPMKPISFKVKNVSEPLKFYQCVCASEPREYFEQTDQDKCWSAKKRMFGFSDTADVKWIQEW